MNERQKLEDQNRLWNGRMWVFSPPGEHDCRRTAFVDLYRCFIECALAAMFAEWLGCVQGETA
jgi:hypothetical protein